MKHQKRGRFVEWNYRYFNTCVENEAKENRIDGFSFQSSFCILNPDSSFVWLGIERRHWLLTLHNLNFFELIYLTLSYTFTNFFSADRSFVNSHFDTLLHDTVYMVPGTTGLVFMSCSWMYDVCSAVPAQISYTVHVNPPISEFLFAVTLTLCSTATPESWIKTWCSTM